VRYNFDKLINRKNTNSLKYDFAKEYGFPSDVIPLWIADMDFQSPFEVIQKLVKISKHSVFGYTDVKDDYFSAVQNWFLKRFYFKPRKEWFILSPGVVFAIAAAVRAFTKENESVLIQTPVYHPFHSVVKINKRNLIKNSLIYSDGKYSIDFKDFERKIIENKVKLFILCSPHNPVGRVWTREELIKIGNICLKHKVIVASDEIHCDFVYKGYKHTIFASLGNKFLNNSIWCSAPSKSFNLAGLQTSNIFAANENLRNKLKLELEKTGYETLNTMGLAACQSAYEHGAHYMDELNDYLEKNLDYIRKFLKIEIPEIKLVEPQGTYLLWLDFNALGFSRKQLQTLTINKAKLWLSDGKTFGGEGKGFFRVNIACPLTVLKKAFGRLKTAMDAIRKYKQ
jgi:cystathionine beta-lyase